MLQPQSEATTEPYENDARTSRCICRMAVVRQKMLRLSRNGELISTPPDPKQLAATSMKKSHH